LTATSVLVVVFLNEGHYLILSFLIVSFSHNLTCWKAPRIKPPLTLDARGNVAEKHLVNLYYIFGGFVVSN
jgi:hypothetical protein